MLKLEDIDTGTKLRTVLAVVLSLNTALMATDITGFENPTVDLIYKILSLVLNFIIIAINTYLNNDYTAAGQVGTTATHILKADPTACVDVYDGDEDDDEPNIEELDPEDNADETIEEGDE